jgi:CNT family concentrative nucleoside transporter
VDRLISLLGYVVLILLAWGMSSRRREFPWRIVLAGTALQFALALVTLKTAPGLAFFDLVGKFFDVMLQFSDVGAKFVFGENFKDHFFAFKVLPTIIFFSCFMSVLYYVGVMQWIVKGMAWIMQRTLGTSGAETLSAAANVFLGQTEAPLVIRPYLAAMTVSELNAVMIGGFANISGGVLAAFVELGIDAGHLVTASVISAPASLLIAKVIEPETARPATLGEVKLVVPPIGTNVIEAAAIGTRDGLMLALNIAAMLIAFMALIALGDFCVAWIGDQVAHFTGWKWADTWSLRNSLATAFAPLAWLIGIPWEDCGHAGELLGTKMFANEFVAYEQLSRWIQPDSEIQLQPRSVTIMTYALCGFSNFASIGIQIGGLGGLAPERQSDLARLGLRAMLGGTLATLMTATIAGVLL